MTKEKMKDKMLYAYMDIIDQLTESLNCEADKLVDVVNILNMTEYWVENKMLDVYKDDDTIKRALWMNFREFIGKYEPQHLSLEELYVADKSEGETK